MKIAPLPPDEEERLRALYEYHIIDTEEEKVFNNIIDLAASICEVPISSVTLLDRNRQWHKAYKGLPPEAQEAPREISFCSHTILQNRFFEITDAKKDERFYDNPLVTGDPNIRYYGGMPLVSPEGYKIGTLCVIDRIPKQLTPEQKHKMKQLSEIVMALMQAKKVMTMQLVQQEKMTSELEKRLIEQKRNYSNLSTLSQMNGMLESCLQQSEAFAVIKNFCQQLFPMAQGYIYLMDAHHENIALASHWGIDKIADEIFTPECCWGLRRGQIYIYDKKDPILICAHLKNQLPHGSYMCLPLIAQGESLGLLTLVFNHDEQNYQLSETEKLLCVAMGEQVALSIANINLRQSLHVKSTTDALTGLYNRRYLFETYSLEFANALAKGTQLILVMLDIDHFKKFNDTYGHEAGDEVLKHVARFIKDYVQTDFVCRLGGEEFVIIFKNKSKETVIKIIEEMRKAIARTKLKYIHIDLPPITISSGIALFPEQADSLEKLLLKADKALYKAKENGRNQTVIATT